MRKDKNPALAEHFAKLKAILPDVYKPRRVNKSTLKSEKLFDLLKNSLSVIEAVYLQNPENFSAARVEAYASIIQELKQMGVSYPGNEELVQRAAGLLILKAKLPMERAGKKPEVLPDQKTG